VVVLGVTAYSLVHFHVVDRAEHGALRERNSYLIGEIDMCEAIVENLDQFGRDVDRLKEDLVELEAYAHRLPLAVASAEGVVAAFPSVEMTVRSEFDRSTVVHFVGAGPPEVAVTLIDGLTQRGWFTVRRLIKGTSATSGESGEVRLVDQFASTDGWEATIWIEQPRPRRSLPQQPPPPHPEVFWPWNREFEATILDREATYEQTCTGELAERVDELEQTKSRVEQLRMRQEYAPDHWTHPLVDVYERAFCGKNPPLTHGTAADLDARRDVVGWMRPGLNVDQVLDVLRPHYTVVEPTADGLKISLDLEPIAEVRADHPQG